MYIVDFPVLNEAEITHGGTIGNSFNRLPKDLQDKIKANLKVVVNLKMILDLSLQRFLLWLYLIILVQKSNIL